MSYELRPLRRRWFKRLGLALLVVLAAALLAGVLYEQSARRQVARNFPPPGKMIDVGGRRMHLDCRGTGSPIVILETIAAPMGAVSWYKVHDAAARITRTCAYDRAGIGWSEPASGLRTGKAIVTDLHQLLTAAHELGPYVMVGASLGGPLVMTFTKYYGQEVAGLVLVDASHPDQKQRIKAAIGRDLDYAPAIQKVLAALVWTGLPRLLMGGVPQPGAVSPAEGAMSAYLPTSLGPSLDEISQLDTTWHEAGALRTLGDRPLAVLTAAKPYTDELATFQLSAEQGHRMQQAWFEMQKDEASWSSRSTQRYLKDSGHGIQLERPDAVIDAIRQVVDQVRGGVPASASDS